MVRFWRAHHTAEPLGSGAPRHLDAAEVAREEVPLAVKALEQSNTNLSSQACNYLAWYCVTGPKEIRSPEQALPLALRAVELSKTNQSVLNTLGVVYYRLGRFTNAVEVFEHNIQQNDVGPVTACDRLFLAMSYHRLGQTERAELAFSKAAEWLDASPAQANQELKEFRAEAEVVLGTSKTK
jgi:tetratricopeptide (TPR) repeat protein